MSLNHINIIVTDLERAAGFFSLFGYSRTNAKHLSGSWFEEVTGFPDAEADYLALGHPDSPVRLELLCYTIPPSPLSGDIGSLNLIGYRHIALEVDHIEEKRKQVEQAGYRFTSAIRRNSYGRKMCYCIGPDGIVVELLSRT